MENLPLELQYSILSEVVKDPKSAISASLANENISNIVCNLTGVNSPEGLLKHICYIPGCTNINNTDERCCNEHLGLICSICTMPNITTEIHHEILVCDECRRCISCGVISSDILYEYSKCIKCCFS